MSVIQVTDLKKSYGGIRALDGCSMSFEDQAINGGPYQESANESHFCLCRLQPPHASQTLMMSVLIRPSKDA